MHIQIHAEDLAPTEGLRDHVCLRLAQPPFPRRRGTRPAMAPMRA